MLSPKEVERLLYANGKLRDRCLLMTAYATGVRVSELVRLKVSDIDSERMMVKVEQGRGKKTATRFYPERLLSELRTYWKEHRSPMYLFPNARRVRFPLITPRESTIWQTESSNPQR